MEALVILGLALYISTVMGRFHFNFSYFLIKNILT